MTAVAFWGLMAFNALGALLVVGHIGKPREPITPTVAVYTLVLTALQVWATVILFKAAS